MPDGDEVYQCHQHRPLEGLDMAGPVALRPGTNVLVFKVVNDTGAWEGCIRLVDEDGRPAADIGVRLTPAP